MRRITSRRRVRLGIELLFDRCLLSTSSLTTVAVPPSAHHSVIAAAVPQLPAAPTNLSWTSPATNQIRLKWIDHATNETFFKIERATLGGTFAVVALVKPNVTTYANTGLAAGTTYLFRVSAANAAGTSARSNTVAAVTLPAAPQNLFAQPFDGNNVFLAWQPATGAAGYRVERSTNGAAFRTLTVVPSSLTTFTDRTLAAGATYTYQIRAVNAGGVSAPSNPVFVPLPAVTIGPLPPTNLAAYQLGPGTTYLTWQPATGTETGYIVERSNNGGRSWSQIAVLSSSQINFTDSAPPVSASLAGTTFLYRLRSIGPTGTSAPSEPVAAVLYFA